ncbi:MAG: hypothetical protein WBY61_09025, partial [Terriglobales bacterium]
AEDRANNRSAARSETTMTCASNHISSTVLIRLLKSYSDHKDHKFDAGAVLAVTREHADQLIAEGIAEEKQ